MNCVSRKKLNTLLVHYILFPPAGSKTSFQQFVLASPTLWISPVYRIICFKLQISFHLGKKQKLKTSLDTTSFDIPSAAITFCFSSWQQNSLKECYLLTIFNSFHFILDPNPVRHLPLSLHIYVSHKDHLWLPFY